MINLEKSDKTKLIELLEYIGFVEWGTDNDEKYLLISENYDIRTVTFYENEVDYIVDMIIYHYPSCLELLNIIRDEFKYDIRKRKIDNLLNDVSIY
jgi:hypothetical protein